MVKRQHIYSIIVMCLVLSLFGVSAEAKNHGREYRIEIQSDSDTYLENMTAEFTVSVSAWNKGKELPFKMRGKYLIAWFPDRTVPVVLEAVTKNTWRFAPVLKGTGQQTLTVELRRGHRKNIINIQHIINTNIQKLIIKKQAELVRLQQQIAEKTNHGMCKELKKKIAAIKRIIAKLQANIAKKEKVLAVASKTITVQEN